MKSLILIFSCLICISGSAQFAIVADVDSFTNVRSGPGKHYPVQDSLKNGDVVFLFESEGNWWPIDYGFENKTFKGAYIYASRTKPIDKFTPIPARVSNDSVLIYQWDSCKLLITERSFKPKKHKFKYQVLEGGDSILQFIDGKPYWGSDGYLPSEEYGKCQLKIGKKTVNLPTSTLYNPNFHLTNLYIDRITDTLYLVAYNSDGAGGYAALWVIQKGVLKQQFVTYSF